MSGIYIHGMKMPTTCGNCWFCHAVSNEKWHCRLTGKSFASYSVGWGNENNTGENGQHPYIRLDNCPLISVPEHGDLVDRDVLCEKLEKAVKIKPDLNGMNAAISFAFLAPTIIPADKEGE